MEFETKVQFLTQPEHNRRTIVISDIHGHRAWLEKLLKKVDFSEKDILIIVGDMIEKGPESLNTIRYIMELCEKYTVYPMMGKRGPLENPDAAHRGWKPGSGAL